MLHWAYVYGGRYWGTKTLLATFTQEGRITEQLRFPTPQKYPEFLHQLAEEVAKFTTKEFKRATVAVPGRLDREHGRAVGYGTLKWDEANVQHDVQKILNCQVTIENDAKLAGLYEARQLHDYPNVLYVTIGTGISCALISRGKISESLKDSEGGQILVILDGKPLQWEDAVSGRAIVERFGQRASEITSEATWKTIARDLSVGLIDLISVIQPDIIVMGGGVSTNFDKFEHYLKADLKTYETPLVPIPPVRRAKRPEEAVVYGCFELAKIQYV